MNSPSLPPLDRRTFLATTTTAVGGLLAGTLPSLAASAVTDRAAVSARPGPRWYEHARPRFY